MDISSQIAIHKNKSEVLVHKTFSRRGFRFVSRMKSHANEWQTERGRNSHNKVSVDSALCYEPLDYCLFVNTIQLQHISVTKTRYWFCSFVREAIKINTSIISRDVET